jgi:nitrite reductase/ring-hydroxylating ferredoxin subunit
MGKLRFFYVLFIGIVFVSCNRDRNNIIPNVLVDVEININNPEYINLMAVGGSMYLSGGSRGIVVYRYSQDTFVAFDRHCPYNPSDACGQVTFDTNSAIILKDVCCGSQFLLTDGSLYSGPATNSLKRYQTFFDGTILRIYN